MTHIRKFIEAGNDNGWQVTVEATPGGVWFERDAEPGEGYPSIVTAIHDSDGVVTGGSIMNGYDPNGEPERSSLGSRSLLGVLTNVDNPFRWKAFYETWVAGNPATLSEKLLAERINVSERQIRNARIMGYMNGWLADQLSIKELRVHPSNVFGFTGWVEHSSKGAWPDPSIPRKGRAGS